MLEETTTKEYKYKIETDDFHYLFSADDLEFESIKGSLRENRNGISRTNNCIKISNTLIEGNAIIRAIKKSSCSDLTFENVKANGIFILDADLDINSQKTNIRFKNCEIERFDAQNSTIGEIQFSNSNVGQIKIRNNKSEDFYIDNCTVKSLSYFKDVIIKDLHIHNCIINDVFEIQDCTTGDLDFRKVASKKLYFYDITSKAITLNNSSTDSINLFKSKIESVYINKSITGNFAILNSQLDQFYAGSHYCSISISNSSITQLRLHSCFIPVLEFSQICNIVADITHGQINNIYFRKSNLSKESLISFSGTSIYFLQIEELSMLGNLYFRHIERANILFDWLTIEEFKIGLDLKEPIDSILMEKTNEQLTKGRDDYKNISKGLKATIKESTIRISQSSLGKTEFIDCPLADFRFEYHSSKITESSVMGDSIPNNNVWTINSKISIFEEHQQKASFFNQFKKIFEAQGDIYHATQFQAKWADEQRKLLELLHRGEKGLFNTTFSDLWILKLNKWSNLHGESWPRAFGWIMGLGLVFYLIYLLSIGRLFTHNEFDFNLIGYYFEFLNPAHKFNFTNEGNTASGWTVFIDIVWRIIVAYLIYQFIAAFRKHTKKQ